MSSSPGQHFTKLSVELYRHLRSIKVLCEDNLNDFSICSYDNTFTVLSYNLMAQHHIWPDSFPPCPTRPEGIHRWSYRKQAFALELLAYSPDIAAFQEMFKWREWWDEWFKEHGYEGEFMEKKPEGRDGCALIWKSNKFKRIQYKGFDYGQLVTEENDGNSTSQPKVNVGQWVILEHLHTGHHLLILNTHLYWKRTREDIRMIQVKKLKQEVCNAIELHSSLTPVSMILTGDFNAHPGTMIYKEITHNMNLHSCYSQIGDTLKEPEFTTFVHDFKGCLDYIFIDQRFLRCTELLLMPETEVLTAQLALPNEIYASDHLALMARVAFKIENENEKIDPPTSI